MRSNLVVGKKKEIFMMYPRFLQIIFNAKYPELEQSGKTHDVKALGPHTFNLMKQVRKVAKDVFQGIKPLEKFGVFAEIEGAASPPISTAPLASSAPPTSSAVPPPVSSYTPTAIVEEEHMPPPKRQAYFEIVDDDVDEDEPGLNLDFDLGSLDYSDEDDSSDENAEYTTDPVSGKRRRVMTDEETQAFIAELEKAVETSPLSDLVTSESPQSVPKNVLSPPRKRSRGDPRPGALVTDSTTVTTTPLAPPTKEIPERPDFPIVEDYVSEEERDEEVATDKATLASGSGSSSAQGPSQGPPGGDPNLSATLKLAQILVAEDETRPSRAGIHIGSDKGKKSARDTDQIIHDLEDEVAILKVKVSDLEREKELQAKQISVLQANLGGLTALVYHLQSQISQHFGDESGSAAAVSAPTTTETAQTQSAQAQAVPSSASPGRRKTVARKKTKGTVLFQKSSDQNRPGDAARVHLTDLEPRRYGDKYGDRSGIRVWGFDRQRDAWVVKRNSGHIEYYEKPTDFMSWTKVGIIELYHAPFYNPFTMLS